MLIDRLFLSRAGERLQFRGVGRLELGRDGELVAQGRAGDHIAEHALRLVMGRRGVDNPAAGLDQRAENCAAACRVRSSPLSKIRAAPKPTAGRRWPELGMAGSMSDFASLCAKAFRARARLA
jgi:hypothetical protein